MFLIRAIAGTLAACCLLADCGGVSLLPDATPEERLSRARAYLDDGDGRKSMAAYRTIAGLYPGTEWEEEARLGVARSQRELGDYFAAVQEYQTFQRRYPRSSRVGDAVLEIAYCYVDQQASPAYDQEWNTKAIRQFEEYIAGHPDHPRIEEGRRGLLEARTHRARKEFENAVTYVKLRRFSAARFYFQIVLDDWGDTPLAHEARYEMARTYELANDDDEAIRWLEICLNEGAEGELAEKARTRLAKLRGLERADND